MKKVIGDTASAEFGGMLNVTGEQQYTFFEWLQHHETGTRSFNSIREALSKFSKGIDDGKELYRKYGKE